MKDTEYQASMPVKEYVENYVDVPKFLEACRHCPIYGKNWACPPFDFDPLDFWAQYKTMMVVCHRYDFEEKDDISDIQAVFYRLRRRLAKEMYALEAENPGSTSLLVGTCDICGVHNCARAIGKPCRHPKWMRHSLESIGGDVTKTVTELFGLDMSWPKDGVMKNMTLCGALLRK
jgi:predicted metal-binding protein